MNKPKLTVCPGTLAEGFSAYSPAFLRKMFGGKSVSHILPYDAPQKNETDTEKFLENRKRISISGVQEKFSMRLEKNKLRLTEQGEQGTYILKPIPRDLKKVDQVPANEHLTMQIARQVYQINTAENGLIFFKSGDPAYITRRFDVRDDAAKWGKEDFATLAGKTSDNAGANFKYEYSYEEMGELIQKYVPAWRIEIEKFFSIVVFNYVFSNGDAHLKNFALLESEIGDYILSPAYDLINTRLHVSDSDFAVNKGLFKDDFASDSYKRTHYRGQDDFLELARRIGINDNRAVKILEPFLARQEGVHSLTKRSFLAEASKRAYLLDYNTRRNRLTNQ
ncbi:MAG: HipA domain-containing protein [Chitinophagaceae bacterium]